MTMYLISFPGGDAAMHVSDEEFPDVVAASHAVIDEARDAGVLVFAGGINEDIDPVMVDADGTTHHRTYPETENLNGGFTILDLPTRSDAHRWAAKIAEACRCAQEVREFQADRNT